MKKILVALMMVVGTAQASIINTVTREGSWESCVGTLQRFTQVMPSKVLVSTEIMAMVRFQTKEGSTLVTCSKLDRKMVVVNTTNPF
jgi:hypothetical protein